MTGHEGKARNISLGIAKDCDNKDNNMEKKIKLLYYYTHKFPGSRKRSFFVNKLLPNEQR